MLPKITNNFNSQLLGLSIYFLIFIRLNYFDYSLVQDEISFLSFSQGMPWFQSPSREYFGQMFWVLLKALDIVSLKVFFAPLSKFLFSSLVLTSLLLSIRFAKDGNNKKYVIFLALTSPFFYWSGKVIGPEVLSTFFIFLSLAALESEKKYLSFLLVGAAAGIKLTAFPALIFLLIIFLLSEQSRLRNCLACLALSLVGFLLMNPTDLFGVFGGLASRPQPQNLDLYSFPSILGNFLPSICKHLFEINEKLRFTWDLIPITSFQDLSFGYVTLILILLTLIIERSKYFFPYLLFLFFQIAWVLAGDGGEGFPWYWTSIVPITLYVFSHLNLELELIRGVKKIPPLTIGAAIIAISFTVSMPTIIASIYQKDRQKSINANYANDMTCIRKNYGASGLPIVKRVDFRVSMDRYEYDIPNYHGGYLLVISDRFFQSDDTILGPLKTPNRYLGKCGNLLVFQLG